MKSKLQPKNAEIELSKKQRDEIIQMYGHIPTRQEVMDRINESQDNLMIALASAWDSAPDDVNIRAEILEALQKALKLKQKINEVFEKESSQ